MGALERARAGRRHALATAQRAAAAAAAAAAGTPGARLPRALTAYEVLLARDEVRRAQHTAAMEAAMGVSGVARETLRQAETFFVWMESVLELEEEEGAAAAAAAGLARGALAAGGATVAAGATGEAAATTATAARAPGAAACESGVGGAAGAAAPAGGPPPPLGDVLRDIDASVGRIVPALRSKRADIEAVARRWERVRIVSVFTPHALSKLTTCDAVTAFCTLVSCVTCELVTWPAYSVGPEERERDVTMAAAASAAATASTSIMGNQSEVGAAAGAAGATEASAAAAADAAEAAEALSRRALRAASALPSLSRLTAAAAAAAIVTATTTAPGDGALLAGLSTSSSVWPATVDLSAALPAGVEETLTGRGAVLGAAAAAAAASQVAAEAGAGAAGGYASSAHHSAAAAAAAVARVRARAAPAEEELARLQPVLRDSQARLGAVRGRARDHLAREVRGTFHAAGRADNPVVCRGWD